jgi:hypothetical protein
MEKTDRFEKDSLKESAQAMREEQTKDEDASELLYDIDLNPVEVAAERDKKVIYPKPNELFIDIDSPENLKIFHKNLVILDRMAVTLGYKQYPSRTEGHCHIIVALYDDIKDEKERCLLQALLGSDQTKELLGYGRIYMKCKHKPTCLFVSQEVWEQREPEYRG